MPKPLILEKQSDKIRQNVDIFSEISLTKSLVTNPYIQTYLIGNLTSAKLTAQGKDTI